MIVAGQPEKERAEMFVDPATRTASAQRNRTTTSQREVTGPLPDPAAPRARANMAVTSHQTRHARLRAVRKHP
jgi:hypothetical protein